MSPRARFAPPARARSQALWQLLPLAVLALAGGLQEANAASAADPPPTEYEVKAAYLYNFARFIEWPAGGSAATDDQLIIGVFGADPFGPLLEATVQDKAVSGQRSLVVRRFSRLDDVVQAHILFISSSEEERLPQILKRLEGASILTVGEMDRFAERGGMVALKLEEKKVRFDINLDAVRRAQLKLSSQLLKLARIVGSTRT